MEDLKNINDSINRLQVSIDDLAKRQRNRADIEDALIASPLIKIGKWALLSVLFLTVVIWIGGTLVSGVEIASLKQQISDAKREVDDTQKTSVAAIESAASDATKQLTESDAKFKTIMEKLGTSSADAARKHDELLRKMAELDALRDTIERSLGDSKDQLTKIPAFAKDLSDLDTQLNAMKEAVSNFDNAKMLENIGIIGESSSKIRKLDDYLGKVDTLLASIDHINSRSVRMQCKVASTTSSVGRNISIVAYVPDSDKKTSVVTGGGCEIPGFYGHYPPITQSIPIENGWSCTANDPPNIPLNLAVRAYVVYCTAQLQP